MKTLILSFSNNLVNEDSFIPNKIGLTFSCVEVCEKEIKELGNEVEHICINNTKIITIIMCHKPQKSYLHTFMLIIQFFKHWFPPFYITFH